MNQSMNSNIPDDKRINEIIKGLNSQDVPKSRIYPTKTVKMGLD